MNTDTLPPHDLEAERSALACVYLASISHADNEEHREAAQQMAWSYLGKLNPRLFYDLRHTEVFNAMRDLATDNIPITIFTISEQLKKNSSGNWLLASTEISGWQDPVPSHANFPLYLETLQDRAKRRAIISAASHAQASAFDLTKPADQSDDTFTEYLEEQKHRAKRETGLKVWRVSKIVKHVVDPKFLLVGDNEISTGYDGVTLVAGPGSSGKSLAVSSLALAGARGDGLWMGRKVHRKFRTLIIQAENGITRLKREVEEMQRLHPELDIENHIFISEPPEGGIPFHQHSFRADVRRAVIEHKPDLVVIDPWSQVAAEDGAKEVVEKISEIRSCFPAGDACPGLLIVAHTNKPRKDVVRKGRGLVNLVSGSIALVNTARAVYLLIPWDDESFEDDRIYWACCKLNNGQMYAPTVWHRRLGTFFKHDPDTDPTTFGEEKRADAAEERKGITIAMLKEAWGDADTLKRSEIVKRLVPVAECGESTAYRALDTYLSGVVVSTPDGKLTLKKGKV